MANQKINITLSNNKGKDIVLDYHHLRKAILTIRAVNHKFRKHIIQLLQENKQLTVTELYKKLKLEQSVASQHLAILRKSGILNTEREGKYIKYSLNKEKLTEINNLIEALTEN